MNIQELVLRAKSGEQEAFRLLYNHFHPFVRMNARKFFKCNHVVEDIAQVTLTKALTNISKYNPDYKFGVWLTTICNNCCVDEYRRRKKRFNTDYININDEKFFNFHPDTSKTPDELLEQEDSVQAVRKGLLKLNDRDRMLISLRYYESLSYKEAAKITEKKMGTFKTQLSRAKKQLKAAMVKDGYSSN